MQRVPSYFAKKPSERGKPIDYNPRFFQVTFFIAVLGLMPVRGTYFYVWKPLYLTSTALVLCIGAMFLGAVYEMAMQIEAKHGISPLPSQGTEYVGSIQ